MEDYHTEVAKLIAYGAFGQHDPTMPANVVEAEQTAKENHPKVRGVYVKWSNPPTAVFWKWQEYIRCSDYERYLAPWH